MPAPPFRIEVYDRAFQMRGPIGNPIFVTVTVKRMAPGLATISVPMTHPRVEDLTQVGARLRLITGDTGDHVMSGFVARYRGAGPSRRATIEFDIVDDLVILQRILGWVVPSGSISQQGTAGTNWEMTGFAETVLKEALRVNGVNRLGLPIQIPPTQGRGAAVKARLRFQTLYDRLILVEDGAGIINSGIEIGVSQRTDAPGLRLDVWEPKTVPQTLSEASGVITKWSVDHSNATATRGVAGGQGEGQLRLFRERIDAALEASMGWKFETFRDARDTDDPNILYERLDETLTEAGPTSGLDVEFKQTANFLVRPGKLWVGDKLTLDVGHGVQVTERLNEATLSWTASGGFETRPRIGERSSDPDRALGKTVGRIIRSIRNRNSET